MGFYSLNPDAMKELQKREDIEPRIVRKILDDNARALYGL
jgi:hypothetical protein